MDTVDRGTRSRIMRAVRGAGTGPERGLQRACRVLGLRPVSGRGGLPGTPDLRFPSARLAVFAHGCFWHGCAAHYRGPRTRRAFWRRKLEGNRRRDRRVRRRLNRMGWATLVVWEHEAFASGARRVLERVRRLGGSPGGD